MRSPVQVRNQRRVLCVSPAYSPSFGTFSHAYRLLGRVRAFMPPQGLLVIASYLPEHWQVRFIDENMGPAGPRDFAWADVVFVSGMHIQAQQIRDIQVRAKAAGKITVLGGPSVSATPDSYPEFDYIHIGEVGDATDRLITCLDESAARRPVQVRLETTERLPLCDFPLPAYHLTNLDRYFIGSLQFSSGCPYRCEFCDIPALYGRQPRMKSPEQVIAELDAIVSRPHPLAIYFVDDNFIGNRKATRTLLPHLVAWQKRRGYPILFACEATLNLAKQSEILELMREANFHNVFVGIESPDPIALKAIDKGHNAALPMVEAIGTLNSYGLEVVAGIILGLDTDTDETGSSLVQFVERSQIPMLTINLLQALPRTPLWDRLKAEARIIEDPSRESNVRFARPYEEVVETWRRCIQEVYAPERLFARFMHQVDATYPNRIKRPVRGQLTRANLHQGFRLALNLAVRVGLLSDYRRSFWTAAKYALSRGQIDAAFGMGLVAYHLIEFSQEARRGEQNASFYAANVREIRAEPRSRRARLPARTPTA